MDEELLTTSSSQGTGERLPDAGLAGRVLGEFVLREQIGSGGYGYIYRAEQSILGRPVVVKVLRWKGRAESGATQRFLREAKLASQLDHPYAAHVYSFGAEPDGLLWIAMELVRGTLLKHLLQTQGSISLARFVPFFEQLCEVVFTAHQQGIVHRDIKPSNVMVLSRAGRLMPKLLDFGIARMVENSPAMVDLGALGDDITGEPAGATPPEIPVTMSNLAGDGMAASATITRRGMSLGSPPYMAPEQWIRAEQSDARTDQYALAIVAYEAVTGRRPFQASNVGAMAIAHHSHRVPPLGPEFPPRLDAVLRRALAKEPDARFESVLALAQAFRAASGTSDPRRAALPRLGAALRETMLARAPQPLADTVAALESARDPARAMEAARQVTRVTIRLVALLAVAALTRVRLPETGEGEAARDALRRLREKSLDRAGWLEVARALLAPFAGASDAHPIPELVLLCFPGEDGGSPDLDHPAAGGDRESDGDGDGDPGGPETDRAGDTRARHASHDDTRDGRQSSRPGDHGDGREPSHADSRGDDPAWRLLQRLAGEDDAAEPDRSAQPARAEVVAAPERRLRDLEQLLAQLGFLCDYPWIVRRGVRNEVWMGARRSARAHVMINGAVEEDQVWLTSGDGNLLLPLSPLCQRLLPAPGAPDEMFLFGGPSRFGARLESFPIGFERYDSELWKWYREALVDLDLDGDPDHPSGDSVRPPYMGLSTFSPADVDYYFGREREALACVNRLRVEPFLAVVGPSGAGKSSFVQAGIIPAMPSYWRPITVRPGPAPLTQLLAALERAGVGEASELRRRLERDAEALGERLRTAAELTGEPVLLVVDQFEELFTLCLDSVEQAAYARALMGAARSQDEAVRVIITLRDDFLVRAQGLPALRERLQQALQILGTPAPTELERILVEPARRAGYAFEDDALPREMVAQVADEPGALALLSFTASRLWRARDGARRKLTRQAYKNLGGVGGALAQHAEETLDAMTAEHQALVREVFRQLITADGTRAVLTRGDLSQTLGGHDRADPVLEALIRARLLVASDSDEDEDRIEVVHEALLSSWPRLIHWQRQDAESARLRDQLRTTARQWVERGRPQGLLWRGDALLEYKVWRGRYRGSLTHDEQEFARRSAHDEARGRRIRRILAIAAFVILAVGMVVVVRLERLASAESDRARLERQRAEDLARESERRLTDLYIEQGRQALLGGEPERAFVYLAEARENGAHSAALDFLLARAYESLDDRLLVLPAQHERGGTVAFSRDGARIATGGKDNTALIWSADHGALLHSLSGHEHAVWKVAFSPDGDRVATASIDGTARIWDASSGRPLWTASHGGPVFWGDFSSDGRVFATASTDRTAKLWDAASGALLHTLRGHTLPITAGAFSPDGDVLVTGSADKSVRAWRVEDGALLATASDLGGQIVFIDASPDRARAVAASRGGAASLLWLGGGRAAATLSGHSAPLWQASFSPDGRRVVTTSDDKTGKIWDPESGRALVTLEGHTGALTYGRFSPDGLRVATAGLDGTARTWDFTTGEPLWTFSGHADGIWSAAFDRSGELLATASFDGTVQVWKARKTRYQLILSLGSEVHQAAFSPDSARIATAEASGVVEIWNRRGDSLARWQGGRRPPYNVDDPLRLAWSPDGRRVIVSDGPAATMWDSAAGRELASFGAHGRRTRHAVYSPRGTRIATAGSDGTAKLWSAENGALLATLKGHRAEVSFVDFAPSGGRIVTASADETARIWDAATGELLHTLRKDGMGLQTARYSVDGRWIITAGNDSTAALWTAEGELVTLFEGHNDALFSASLSRDGALAATASADGSVKLWDARSGSLLWSQAIPVAHLGWAELSGDGELVVVAAGTSARISPATREARSSEHLAEFAACRVAYELIDGQLKRRARDHGRCNRRNSRRRAR